MMTPPWAQLKPAISNTSGDIDAESLEILNNRALMQQIRKGQADFRAGRYITGDEVRRRAREGK